MREYIVNVPDEEAEYFVNTCQLTSEESVIVTDYAERVRKAVDNED